MRIRKYDIDYSRRLFLSRTVQGAFATGVLAPLWPLIAKGDTSKAYPDEITSVEMYTKGKVKTGDVLTADNVDAVKDLLDPITFRQVKEMGRRIKIAPTVQDPTLLFPPAFLEATLRNKGKAKLDADGNIVEAASGNPWLGGLPFAEAQSGLEAVANLTLSWGRHDYSQYPMRQWDIGPDGKLAYQYDFAWVELQVQSRIDNTVFRGKKDLLRLFSLWFTSPQDVAGTSFLTNWYYDQRKFPDLYGYLPAFRRVRQFPTNQRFEPLLPGITWFLSDAWGAGDPMLTWGNYKVVGRQPMLGAVSQNWNGSKPGWQMGAHGGPKGQTFWDTNFSMCPECIVVETEPTGYPRAPVGKKRLWIDVRNQQLVAYNSFDRRGEIWKSVELGCSRMQDGNAAVKDPKGNYEWTWTHFHIHDIQSNRMSRILHAPSLAGGHKSQFSDNGVDVYNKYLTNQAITRLGQA
ncbi:MAG: hypothetical protein JWN85_2979 [Gammaproteobacteria bacterium]|nr:hypothetical protein [Gammaproteobacteria bacterium]